MRPGSMIEMRLTVLGGPELASSVKVQFTKSPVVVFSVAEALQANTAVRLEGDGLLLLGSVLSDVSSVEGLHEVTVSISHSLRQKIAS